MEVVKKNIVLFSVLGIALVISGVLFYMVINKKSEYDESKEKLANLTSQVKSLNREVPAPIKENLDNIKLDIGLLDKKVNDLNKIFGKPYRKALTLFASILLGEKDEKGEFNSDKAYDDIRQKWRAFWQKEAKKEISLQKLLVKFINDLRIKDKDGKLIAVPEAQQKKAWEEFRAYLTKTTLEPIHQDSVREILLESLGLPRQMRGVSCVDFMTILNNNLNRKLRKDGEVQLGETVKYFTFDSYLDRGTTMPVKENIPFIVKHWKMIEDLSSRLLTAKGDSKEELKFNALARLNSLMGTNHEKEFLVFRYSMELIGDLDVIRALINNMQKAYKDDRIYIVKNVELVKQVDNAQKIRESSEKIDLGRDKRSFDFRSVQDKVKDKEEFEEKVKELKKVVIGFNNLVKAKIEFDYVIYIGDELKVVH